MKCLYDEFLISLDICLQCGNRVIVLMFDEVFCEKCYKELELNMFEVCLLDLSCLNLQIGLCLNEIDFGMIYGFGMGYLIVNILDVIYSNGFVDYI